MPVLLRFNEDLRSYAFELRTHSTVEFNQTRLNAFMEIQMPERRLFAFQNQTKTGFIVE